MPELDDLLKQLLAQRTQSSTQIGNSPMSGQPVVRMSPDRLWATDATIEPNDPDTIDRPGFTTFPNTPNFPKTGLQYQGLSNKQPIAYVDKFADPSIAFHEDIHQTLGDLANTLGMKYHQQIDPMIKKIESRRPDAASYDEFPAYLFANPKELYDTPKEAQSAQLEYLNHLHKLSPDKANLLSQHLIDLSKYKQ